VMGNPAHTRKRRKKRKHGGRRKHARRARVRTIVIRAANPRKHRRRRRHNPALTLRRPVHHLRRRSRRRRNPEGFLHTVFVQGIWQNTVKPNWLPAAIAGGADLFVMDPLVQNIFSSSKFLQGPAKALAYPLVTSLATRLFLKNSPRASALLARVAVFGFAFGIKDTIARLTGAPQAAMGDLADAYARRAAVAAAQHRQIQQRNGMRYMPAPQRQMQFMPARPQMGYMPAPAQQSQMRGFGNNPYSRH